MSEPKKIPKQSKHSPLIKRTRSLLRRVNEAVNEYGLIADGDRVLIALSGGKDSLSLLHLLREHKRFFPFKYTLNAVHVVSDFAENACETKNYLAEVCEAHGIPLGFTEIHVTTDKKGNPCDPSCFWCSWNRRQSLFEYCADNGFTRLALGHHTDDMAETTLMNLAYHGNIETMLPRRSFFDGTFDVIRPLFYIRERQIVDLAKAAGFLSKTCTCEFDKISKRRVMKDFVRQLSKEAKYLHRNIWRASRKWHDTFPDRPTHPKPKEGGGEGE